MQHRYLTRKEQAQYLTERGLRISPNTLTKLATTGGGPRYTIWGNKALSTPEWLDEWTATKLGTPRRSTSEAA